MPRSDAKIAAWAECDQAMRLESPAATVRALVVHWKFLQAAALDIAMTRAFAKRWNVTRDRNRASLNAKWRTGWGYHHLTIPTGYIG